MKLIDKLKTMITKTHLTIALFVVVIFQNIIDMDYLLYPLLASTPIPLPSTIINLLLVPLLIFLTFIILEEKKKTVLLIVVPYGILLGVYFLLHHNVTVELFQVLRLPQNFSYSVVTEALYIYRLMLPIALLYTTFKLEFEAKLVEKGIVILSAITSIPLVVANLFTFGPSTYQGNTVANMFSWFFGIYEHYDRTLFGINMNFDTVYHPRFLATQFFFKEGNTTGIVMFMVLPLLILVFQRTRNKKIIPLIFTHCLAMFVLATRVATYGVLLVIIAMLAGYIFFVLLKKIKFDKLFVGSMAGLLIAFALIFPFSPAYVNMQVDAMNDGFVKEDDYLLERGREGLGDIPDMDPFSQEYLDFYTYMFEEYAFLISSIPKPYYMKYYDYRLDPKFWVDVIFDYDLEERVSGRQFQRIFFNVKHANLTSYQKLFGFGYTRFMMGSIVLEKDFTMHYFTFGPIGMFLFFVPWLIAILFIVFRFFADFKRNFNLELMAFAIAIFGGLMAAYMSGHVMDQYATSFLLAWLLGIVIHNVKKTS